MASDIDIDVDLSRFEHKWGMLLDIVKDEISDLLKRFMWGFGESMDRNRLRGDWKNPSRIGVGNRTGALKKEFARSLVLKAPTRSLRGFTMLMSMSSSPLKGMYSQAIMGQGVSRKYASMLEYGGTIRKKRKKLKVPLRSALTPDGVPTKAARSKNLTVLVRKKGGQTKVFLGIKGRGGAKDVFYWILKDSVQIKARLGFFRHFEEYKNRTAPKLIERAASNISAKFERA